MRGIMLVALMAFLAACSGGRMFPQFDQCMAPTPKEAKITKKVWM